MIHYISAYHLALKDFYLVNLCFCMCIHVYVCVCKCEKKTLGLNVTLTTDTMFYSKWIRPSWCDAMAYVLTKKTAPKMFDFRGTLSELIENKDGVWYSGVAYWFSASITRNPHECQFVYWLLHFLFCFLQMYQGNRG